MNKRIWITWEEQRRNWELADSFNSKYYCLWQERKAKKSEFARYLHCIRRTLKILRLEKPKVLFVQNPSKILALTAVLLKSFFRYKLIIDSHNEALSLNSNFLVKLLAKFIQRNSDLTIVSNDELRKFVVGKSTALPDKIPVITSKSQSDVIFPLYSRCNVLFVCSFAKDEPYEEIIKAAKLLPKDIHIFVTGNYSHVYKTEEELPKLDNLHFLGWVSWEMYDHLLLNCHFVIDLTTREDCLLCGAYESVAVEKPMILSDTKALKSYFNRGAVFCKNEVSSIVDSIILTTEILNLLKNEIAEFKSEIESRWKIQLDKVSKEIDTL